MAAFGKTLLKTGALKFGLFTLAGGKISPYYIDLRLIPSFPGAFSLTIGILEYMVREKVGLERSDVIAGIPTSGLTLASALAYKLSKPLIYVRREPKTHGMERMVEGLLPPGSSVILIDDVITDGRSKLDAFQSIRAEGGEVRDAVVLIDRMEGGREALAEAGIHLHAFTSIVDLAKHLMSMGSLDEEQYQAILSQVKRG